MSEHRHPSLLGNITKSLKNGKYVQDQIKTLFTGIQPRCRISLAGGLLYVYIYIILVLVEEGSLARLFLLSDSHITKDIYRNNMISNNFSLSNTHTERTFNQFKNFNMFKLTYGWDTLQTFQDV